VLWPFWFELLVIYNVSENRNFKQLGSAQFSCLENLGRGWTWRYGWRNSWVWDSAARTKRILDTLVVRGLAVLSDGYYSISEAGTVHLASLKKTDMT
jgi:hypothetical protein